MARPQEFETTEALRTAMYLFWSHGYEATSLVDILAATGLSKSSLYATFGGKRELFLAAFNTYRKEHLHYLQSTLRDGQPARQSIETFFRQGIAHSQAPPQTYGCMTANEAVELAPHDVEVQRLVADDFQAVEDEFTQAVQRGQTDGSITTRQEPRTLARFLLVSLQGFQVMARAQSDLARLDASVTVMMAALDG
jgi:TetR/AcrR family transcriptional regulator, transcriptional repressor for nem operon